MDNDRIFDLPSSLAPPKASFPSNRPVSAGKQYAVRLVSFCIFFHQKKFPKDAVYLIQRIPLHFHESHARHVKLRPVMSVSKYDHRMGGLAVFPFCRGFFLLQRQCSLPQMFRHAFRQIINAYALPRTFHEFKTVDHKIHYFAPLPNNTTPTVWNKILISRRRDQLSIYSRSYFTTSSKSSILLRPLTCHIPVSPGVILILLR